MLQCDPCIPQVSLYVMAEQEGCKLHRLDNECFAAVQNNNAKFIHAVHEDFDQTVVMADYLSLRWSQMSAGTWY